MAASVHKVLWSHLNGRDASDIIWGHGGNDVLRGVTNGKTHEQIHMYGEGGNDLLLLDHSLIRDQRSVQHGVHVFGGSGADIFSFSGVASMRGTAYGRIEDLDVTRDRIQIDGAWLDLKSPRAFIKYSVEIVSHLDQQWLLIDNRSGGRLFYGLDSARSMEGHMAHHGGEEAHFLSKHPDFEAMQQIAYENPFNHVTPLYDTSTKGMKHYAGSDGEDLIRASVGDDHIFGRRGDDKIYSGAGDDRINCFIGMDCVVAGDGNDTVQGDKGHDTLFGGNGHDVIFGGSDNDVIRGGADNDKIYGGADKDSLWGEAGDDFIHGGTGADSILGGDGNDGLWGARGDDRLLGESGDDTLVGGGGQDILSGGAGQDQLSGGSGCDSFMFYAPSESPAHAVDTILDFQRGQDRINLSQIDANSLVGGDQTFAFSGFHGSAVWVTKKWEGVFVNADTNRDGQADLSIYVKGIHTLTAEDFIL